MALQQFMVDAFKADESETFAKAVAAAKAAVGDVAILVTSGKKYVGIIDDRSLRDFEGNPATTKIGHIAVKNIPSLYLNSTDEEVVEKFLASETKVLPVLDKDAKPLGVVTRASALSILKQASSLRQKKVYEFMSAPVLRIFEGEHIAIAKKLMKDYKVFHLPVVDADGNLSGIISTNDLALKVKPVNTKAKRESTFYPTREVSIESEPISSIMETNVKTISEAASLMDAVETMISGKMSSLIILRGGKPHGILTTRDLFSSCLVLPQERVVVTGLSEDDEMMFKNSIYRESANFLNKLKKKVVLAPEDALKIHIKSTREGMKRRYEIKSNLSVAGNVFASDSPANTGAHSACWDIHLALKESLDELESILLNSKMFRPRRGLPKKWYLETEDESQAEAEQAIKEGEADVKEVGKNVRNKKVAKKGDALK